ncbi:MAG: hypothetical protein QXF66_03900 [Candidatus Hadarchaeales archaeon]
MKGQTSVEYLVLLSAILVLIATFSYSLLGTSERKAKETLYLSQAGSASQLIASALEGVVSEGEGSVRTITVKFDQQWNLKLRENEVRVEVLWEKVLVAVRPCRYGFQAEVSRLQPGTYPVIVGWPGDMENLWLENGRIYLYIEPRE